MPLEVSEIGISVHVSQTAEEMTGKPAQGPTLDDEEAREELIAECIRRVLDAIRSERER